MSFRRTPQRGRCRPGSDCCRPASRVDAIRMRWRPPYICRTTDGDEVTIELARRGDRDVVDGGGSWVNIEAEVGSGNLIIAFF